MPGQLPVDSLDTSGVITVNLNRQTANGKEAVPINRDGLFATYV
jgi:hypothetical protein